MSAAPVLAPIDLSDPCNAALTAAADLAERSGTELHVLNARASMPAYSGPGDRDAGYRAMIEVGIDRALGPGACAALKPAIHVAHAEAPASAALRLAGELGPQAIVLGTHGRTGFQRFVHGSVAEDVIRRAQWPVLAVPIGAERVTPGPDRPIVVGTDLSAYGAAALRAGRAHADRFGAPVVVLHVVPPNPQVVGPFLTTVSITEFETDVPPDAVERTHVQVREAGLEGAEVVVLRGLPAELIDREAQAREAGCVVLGTHGRTGLGHALVGSVAESVLRASKCSVLIVRPDEGETE
jgi:nucleotide-binding universal stress UspA family protein